MPSYRFWSRAKMTYAGNVARDSGVGLAGCDTAPTALHALQPATPRRSVPIEGCAQRNTAQPGFGTPLTKAFGAAPRNSLINCEPRVSWSTTKCGLGCFARRFAHGPVSGGAVTGGLPRGPRTNCQFIITTFSKEMAWRCGIAPRNLLCRQGNAALQSRLSLGRSRSHSLIHSNIAGVTY
jgi:hypothetical protein